MKRITNQRLVTPADAAKYKLIRSMVAAELPELIERHHARTPRATIIEPMRPQLPEPITRDQFERGIRTGVYVQGDLLIFANNHGNTTAKSVQLIGAVLCVLSAIAFAFFFFSAGGDVPAATAAIVVGLVVSFFGTVIGAAVLLIGRGLDWFDKR